MTTGKQAARKLRKYATPYARKALHRSKRGAKLVHHHAAKRPHTHLSKRWKWYARWHAWDYHKHVHAAVLASYVLVVSITVFGFYEKTQALSNLADNWSFSNASDYDFSAGVENIGNSAKLKAQNYTTDSNTAALYHFDAPGGDTATDSSSHHNDGTLENASFDTGNLNNALKFNGTSSLVKVSSSDSLSLSKQNTIEAWTKFDGSFSAGNSSHRQSIVDKGDYQLYYDNETGKVTYELANKNADSWSQVGGDDINSSWDHNGKRSVNAYTKMGSSVYAGIGSDVGDAEVWKWDGSNWSQIGGGPHSINGSWDSNTYEGVYSLATDGTNLYAGLGAGSGDGEVWKWNGSTWDKIGGDSLNDGWTNYADEVWSLEYVGGKLYAGLGSSSSDAEVWSWNGSSWDKIGGDDINSGWATGYRAVSSLTSDGTNLYAGLGYTAGQGEVWKWNGHSWTKLAGDGLNSSWGSSVETVRSLRYYNNKLYAGLGDSAGDAEVWSWSGTVWTKIGGDGVNGGWLSSDKHEQVGALTGGGGNIYVGLGVSNGDGEVWRFDGSSWTKIGGDDENSSWSTREGDTVNALLYDDGKVLAGTYDSGGSGLAYSYSNGSWTKIGGDYINNSWGFYGFSAVQVMQNVGDYLYAGMGNTQGSATVWRFDGTTWKLIGGQGINSSWESNTYEQVLSMTSYNNHLFVGLGTTADDAEVWEWDGSNWTKMGGDGVNNGWANGYESVDSMASYNGYLYAGLGSSRGDGEVWQWDGTSWSKIGGDSVNNGWSSSYYDVLSMAVQDGKLVAGLGRTTGEAEVWQWDGTSWLQIGGDNIAGSWGTTTYQSVESLIVYNGNLYAGVGNAAGSGALWKYDGTSWSKVGGDDVNGSWISGTYERVKTLAVYNGNLYAGLGSTTGDGEAWEYDGSDWEKVGGNSVNSGWSSGPEEADSFSAYKGKLYAGTGLSTNNDALVWAIGNNAFLQSDKSSFDTDWHHVAATYDGTTMKIYIDGVENASRSATISLPQSGKPLLIGTSYGGREYGKPVSSFDGSIDELRISDVARSKLTARPYLSTPQTVTLANAIHPSGVWHWDGFTDNETANGGLILFRLSADDGTNWLYWDGTDWVTSSDVSQSNDVATIDAHIDSFPVTLYGLKWQAILQGDGNQRVALNSVGTTATSDVTLPSNSTGGAITAAKTEGGASLASSAWTNSGSPYFSWPAAEDGESGIKGYCLYLGDSSTADPITTDGILGASPKYAGDQCQFLVDSSHVDLGTVGYLRTALATSHDPYYLIVKSIDNAGNVSSAATTFNFKFDNTPPSNPSFITAPSGFVNTKDVALSWPSTGTGVPEDDDSGLAGLQYRIGSHGTWYGSSHTGTGDTNDLLPNNGTYTLQETPDFANLSDGINTIYFRTWDKAGNVSNAYVTAALKLNTSGAPSEPQDLQANPASNVRNAFSFSWSVPATYIGSVSNLTYCYSINTEPTASNCTFTPPGATSLGSGPYATQPGKNVLYVTTKDESGNINYANYASVEFEANTPAPGIPLNSDIVDVSIKSTNNWRLALTWDVPTNSGTGISNYKIYRSTDNVNFKPIGSSSSTTYIDAGLSQKTYYYQVKACDSTNNCGATGAVVHDLPTGKFTSSARLVSAPVVSDVTTRKAAISWSTDRASDSKIAIGTTSGKYGSSEIASSDQVSAHQIEINNLSAGTTYYYVAKWTDEDGNTGVSQEYTFRTRPAPSLKEITTLSVSLHSATVRFTSSNAAKVSLYYGPSESFGGVESVNTASAESTYNIGLSSLKDGTKYFYKLVSYDSEGNSYEGSIASFKTPPAPHVSNLRFQPIAGRPTSTQQISWTTNVPSTSSITYGVIGTAGTELASSEMTAEHTMTVSDLIDDSEYFLFAQSRDQDGNLAVSDRQLFHTALDTRPPKIRNISVESSIRGTGADARGQVVVSWTTDEPATSQVAYAEGSSATVFNNKTAEDTGRAFEHIVIVSDLPTSKVYSVQPVSRDKADNTATGKPQSAIISRASDSVLTIVLNTLQGLFGF